MTKLFDEKRLLWLAVGLICLLTVGIGFPLFSSQLLAGHDSKAAFIRVLGMQEYLGSGQLFVRWFPDLNWGYGGPVFNFYPPLFYFVTAAVNVLLGNQPALALNLTLFGLWCLSGVSMFFLVRHYWGGWAGLLSATAYIYAPYHVVDVYTRGAYAEFMAFALLPWIILSVTRLFDKARAGWFVSTALSTGALFLAHNATCLMFMPFLMIYVFILFLAGRQRGHTLWWVGTALSLGAALTAFFWLPALLEKSSLRTDFLVHGRYDFWKNFLDWPAIFSLPWPFSSAAAKTFDGIAFDVGGWQVLLALMTLILFAVLCRLAGTGLKSVFFGAMVVLALLLCMPVSRPVWDRLPLLHFLQFPWRFLVLVSFGLSVLAGGWLSLVNNRKLRAVSAVIAITLLVVSGMRITVGPRLESMPTAQPQTQIFSSLFLGEGEYTPRWIVSLPSAPSLERILVAMGKVKIWEVNAPSKVEYTFSTQAASPGVLVANIFYYPGWHVYIDGKDTEISPDPINGRIFFQVPPGEHQVRIKLELTRVQFWSVIASWMALVILLTGVWFLRRRGHSLAR